MRNTARLFRLVSGDVRIRRLTPEIWQSFDPETETEAEFFERWMAHQDPAVESGVLLGDVDETTGPVLGDRKFRNALGWVDGSPGINMGKARTSHMDRIREARDRELTRLDGESLAALESRPGARPLPVIAAEKQVLLDLPQTFDLTGAKDTAALDALWPAELPART